MSTTGRSRAPQQPASTKPMSYSLNGRKVIANVRKGQIQVDADTGEIDELIAMLEAAKVDRANVIEQEIKARTAVVEQLRKAA